MNAIVKARPSAYAYINPRAVKRREGHNPRFDFGEIEELAKSIRHQAVELKVPGGLLQALRVEKIPQATLSDGSQFPAFEFELIDGDRRLTAIELLIKWHAEGRPDGYDFPDGVPAYMVTPGQSEVDSLLQMFEANTGKPFLPLEEAGAYKRMRDAGMTLEQIGKAVQRKHVHIVSTLALLDADESLQQAVASGEVGGTVAKKIATAARGDKKKQAELTADAKAAGKKDKKALAKVKQKIEQTRQDRAAAKGKTLKIRPITSEQIQATATSLVKHFAAVAKEAGIDPNAMAEELRAWAAKDEARAAAFTFGVLQGLAFCAGARDIKLEI